MPDIEFVNKIREAKLRLHSFFLRHTEKNEGDKAESADDLVQETIEKALPYSRLPKYASRLEDLIWIVAWNVLCLHYKKGKNKVPPHHAREELRKQIHRDPIPDFINKDRWEKLKKTMAPTTWTICHLRSKGYEYREIAEMLSLSEGAVKMRIQRLT